MGFEDCLLIILAILFPPIPVFIKTGCDSNLLLNILLTLIGWLPGVIHAIYVIAKYDHHSHHTHSGVV